MATSQSQKYSISLSGEFFVTAELLRRGVMAAVTYGNAKKADVVAVSGSHAVKIEVKTSQTGRWALGSSPPSAETAPIWVLVRMPEDLNMPPRFHVLTAEDLLTAIAIRDVPFHQRYRDKHGKEFEGRGVYNVVEAEIAAHAGRWDKITKLLPGQDGKPK